MTNPPFLSVVLPVYNASPYLERCIRSLLALDMPQDELEIIFVDDCSPDDSARIIQEAMKQHPHFRLIRHAANKRAGGARNTGLRAASGKYVFFCDPDDEVVPAGLVAAVNHVRTSAKDLDVAMFDFMRVPGGKEMAYKRNITKVMAAREFFAVNEVAWAPWLSLYRREYLLKNNMIYGEGVLFEDVDWVLRAQSYAQRIQYCPIVIYKYHANETSQTNTRPSEEKVRCWLQLALRTGKLAAEHESQMRGWLQSHSLLVLKKGLFALCYLPYGVRARLFRMMKNEGMEEIRGGGIIWAYSHCGITNLLMSVARPAFLLYAWIKRKKNYK